MSVVEKKGKLLEILASKAQIRKSFLRHDKLRYRAVSKKQEEGIHPIWIPVFEKISKLTTDKIFALMQDCFQKAQAQPIKVGYYWLYKDFYYFITGDFSDDQRRLLILEEYDKERKYWEKLKQKHDSILLESNLSRPRIPENVRIEVWRRDSGKCVRCGSREKLEYDHIIPVSKGGGNTARNIELLCERCNRSKGANI